MKITGFRKYYFEKKLKQKENPYCTDKKVNYISTRNKNYSDIKNQPLKLQRYSTKPNLLFNEKKNKINVKKNLFVKENKENYNINENTLGSKDTQENTLRKHKSINNFEYFQNNLRKSKNRFSEFQMKLSTPFVKENLYKNYIGFYNHD